MKGLDGPTHLDHSEVRNHHAWSAPRSPHIAVGRWHMGLDPHVSDPMTRDVTSGDPWSMSAWNRGPSYPNIWTNGLGSDQYYDVVQHNYALVEFLLARCLRGNAPHRSMLFYEFAEPEPLCVCKTSQVDRPNQFLCASQQKRMTVCSGGTHHDTCTLGCSSVGRLARMSLNVIRVKEEH